VELEPLTRKAIGNFQLPRIYVRELPESFSP
jgi:hypothetical protein